MFGPKRRVPIAMAVAVAASLAGLPAHAQQAATQTASSDDCKANPNALCAGLAGGDFKHGAGRFRAGHDIERQRGAGFNAGDAPVPVQEQQIEPYISVLHPETGNPRGRHWKDHALIDRQNAHPHQPQFLLGIAPGNLDIKFTPAVRGLDLKGGMPKMSRHAIGWIGIAAARDGGRQE